MSRTLYAVLQETQQAASDLRQSASLPGDIAEKLARFEAAIDHALASSPDGKTVAHPEEYVALDALCDLHVALQEQSLDMRERLRPIVDEWIAYAASTGLTPQELEAAHREPVSPVDGWLETID
jgi:hypothetical protein